MRQAFAETGRLWLRDAVPPAEVRHLRDLSKAHDRPGARIGAGVPLFSSIAASALTRQIAALWPGMRPVRLLSFNKSEGGAGWSLPWHQDRVIAVRDRAEVAGYGGWTRKDGVWHCEPPEALLQRMLFVRLHLDRNHAANGAMEIALGSHSQGRISADRAEAAASACEREVAVAGAGDVLVLAMLTLHRSLPAPRPDSRRVLRIDYSADALPPPLAWSIVHDL